MRIRTIGLVWKHFQKNTQMIAKQQQTYSLCLCSNVNKFELKIAHVPNKTKYKTVLKFRYKRCYYI